MSSPSPIEVARSYFRAWTTHDVVQLDPLVADRVEIEVPMNSYATKQAFLDAVATTARMTSSVTLLAEFGTADDALLLYDMTLPFGLLRVAEHFTVAGGTIHRIRQVHDTAALRAAGFDRKEGKQ